MSAKDILAGKAFVQAYVKDGTQAGLEGIEKKFGAFAGRMAKAGGIAVTIAASAVAASVVKAISTGAEIGDLAERYGIGTTAIQQLSYAAKQSGTDLDTLVAGIRNMQKGLGGGTLGDELKALGISMQTIRGLAPEKQFEIIGDAIGSLPDPAQRTAMAMKIFGKAGAELIPLFGNITEHTERFNKSGRGMSEEMVKMSGELDDQLGELNHEFKQMAIALGTSLIPGLQNAAKWFKLFGLLAKDAEPQAPFESLLPPPGAAAGQPPHRIIHEAQQALLDMIARSETKAKAREQSEGIRDGISALREMLGLRSRDIAPRNLAKLPGNLLNGIYDYLSGSAIQKMRADAAAWGTFDKRDIAGGAWLQATNQQLEELRKHTAELRKLNAKKEDDGIKWN